MEYLLMMAGFVFSVVVILIIVRGVFVRLKDCIVKLRRRYQYKHRFDKPPIAKCYCVDCKWYSEKYKKCCKFDRWATSDNWFCWDATPKE
ncbi:hypothetical protein [Chryseobacterium sp.]|uniref:hypothetical protein n=1 Tax=Chryseobacterium sp. TaxID=1871047 RepID=UPI002FC718AC